MVGELFVNRDWTRSEHDDFALNVSRYMGKYDWATPIYNINGIVIGWKIKPAYE